MLGAGTELCFRFCGIPEIFANVSVPGTIASFVKGVVYDFLKRPVVVFNRILLRKNG